MPKSPAVTTAVLLATLLFCGCQGTTTGGDVSASASPTSTMYSGQPLPTKVDLLSGTPYYANSEKLAAAAKLDGAPFLLMAPQDPTKALLVVEQGSPTSALVGRPSELSNFSGVTELVEAPELAKLVKDDVGVELKQDESGKIVVLKVQKPAGGAAATATPASTPGTQP